MGNKLKTPANFRTGNSLGTGAARQEERHRGCWPQRSGAERAQAFSPSHLWQRERERILHRASKSVAYRISHGARPRQAFRSVSRYLNGRVFKSDPHRRLAMSENTLRRAFQRWRRGGEVAAAFRLHYQPRRAAITAPVLWRFTNFCASQPLGSLKSAWQKFAARAGSFGRGRHASKPLRISYGQLRYHFPAADFYLIQAELKAIQAAQTHLARLRLKIMSDIRARLPEQPSRRRVKKELDYSI